MFTVLSNTVRLGVLLRLIEREWSVGELAADMKMGQSAISQHLGKLREAGVVCARKDRQALYSHCSDETVILLLSEFGIIR
ncbi:metalloregulator ArsR/SmtB family transcription factor [Agrobacterium sp. MA01]|uniref:ArsR/SmtB family transcription factor n=1 Tax=Agrobacterium sp. MA01 TaxID=2664893 RepID=UPI001FF0361D|nr:metalloregulator ArsR/SmtB family transcription factor [Agrobacterium sp. MA01]